MKIGKGSSLHVHYFLYFKTFMSVMAFDGLRKFFVCNIYQALSKWTVSGTSQSSTNLYLCICILISIVMILGRDLMNKHSRCRAYYAISSLLTFQTLSFLLQDCFSRFTNMMSAELGISMLLS